MEIRVLRYFIEIAREGSMTAAADVLHVSQSALSKQMKELENELGKKLFRRGSRSVSLTDEGILLRRRAEDILDMVDKTTDEFKAIDDLQGGDVYLGCAESYLISSVAQKIKKFKSRYPLFRYHIISGDRTVVLDRLDRGLLDFGVVVEMPSLDRYQYLELPGADTWGVIMPRKHPLAKNNTIHAEDLYGEELICSEQSIEVDIPRWCGKKIDKLNFTGNTNLAYNGSVFVKEGLGLMLTFEHLIQPSEENGLVFRPLEPKLENKMYLIWKKYQVFTPIAQRLLDEFLE
ncbi:MAG: LysR family transcriptional regulator [Clostridia bacterium]|nr:LysR family transcriptional regulator [Clostridia bacterium]